MALVRPAIVARSAVAPREFLTNLDEKIQDWKAKLPDVQLGPCPAELRTAEMPEDKISEILTSNDKGRFNGTAKHLWVTPTGAKYEETEGTDLPSPDYERIGAFKECCGIDTVPSVLDCWLYCVPKDFGNGTARDPATCGDKFQEALKIQKVDIPTNASAKNNDTGNSTTPGGPESGADRASGPRVAWTVIGFLGSAFIATGLLAI